MKFLFSLFLIAVSVAFSAQTGSININVYDEFSKKALPAIVSISNDGRTFTGEGNITVSELPSGNYTFDIRSANYETGFLRDINILPNQNLTYSICLNKVRTKSGEHVINKKQYKTTAESPLSLRNMTSEEVQKNAGSTRDVSKAILSFPGVGSTATFRNDLFIRGGSS